VHLLRCCASVPLARLKSLSEKCRDENLFSKKSLTVNVCNCINAAMSTFIARGLSYFPSTCFPSVTTKSLNHIRKGKDYTYLYGKHVGTGSLTPFIDSVFDPRIEEYVSGLLSDCTMLTLSSLILDGEMLVWDPVSERNLPFGHLKTAALGSQQSLVRAFLTDASQINRRKNTTRARVVRTQSFTSNYANLVSSVKVFDLLYVNGMSLLQKPLKFRKRNLRAYIKEKTGRIEFATEFEGTTAKDVRQRMDDILAARGEGLVMKHPDSEYVLNGRNKDWIKVSDCLRMSFLIRVTLSRSNRSIWYVHLISFLLTDRIPG